MANRPIHHWANWEKIIAGLAIAALVLFAIYAWQSDHAQKVAHRMAGEYAARAELIVAADPRFKNVVVYEFSAYGCARVHGWVSTEADLEALHKVIEATAPPKNIQIMWTVKVNPNPDLKEKEAYPFPNSTP